VFSCGVPTIRRVYWDRSHSAGTRDYTGGSATSSGFSLGMHNRFAFDYPLLSPAAINVRCDPVSRRSLSRRKSPRRPPLRSHACDFAGGEADRCRVMNPTTLRWLFAQSTGIGADIWLAIWSAASRKVECPYPPPARNQINIE